MRIAVWLLCWSAACASAQISPGPLLRAHEDLEGMTRCVRCHPLGRKEMDVACLDCHREIDWLRTQSRGLHAKVADKACSSCHADHAGKDFDPIGLKEDGFEHSEVGWQLEGKHAQLECAACHRRELWKAPARSQRGEDSTRQSYLGLDTRCISCHLDDHDKQLGEDCLACHAMQEFATAPGFRHEKTKFPLRGKHLTLGCEKCHSAVEAGGKSMVFPARNVTQCSACHKDPHTGRLGPKCSECHSETDWNSNIGAGFDHSKTRFALVGAHRSVKCERCHDEKKGWGAKPAFASCTSCHSDPHRDTAKQAQLSGDCKRCHDERSFKPSQFDVAAHAKARFPLEGAHRKVACATCHKPTTAAKHPDSLGFTWKYAAIDCASCHQDAHGNQLAQLKGLSADCTGCHDQQHFKPSRFGRAEHAKTAFVLDAAHVDVACARCHASTRAELAAPAGAGQAGKAHFVFALSERACADCHFDPHQAGARSRECERCHVREAWSPTRIDIATHAQFGLDLKGAHAALPCIECHKGFGQTSKGSTLLNASSSRRLPFAQRVRDCKDCHAKLPGGSR